MRHVTISLAVLLASLSVNSRPMSTNSLRSSRGFTRRTVKSVVKFTLIKSQILEARCQATDPSDAGLSQSATALQRVDRHLESSTEGIVFDMSVKPLERFGNSKYRRNVDVKMFAVTNELNWISPS